MSVLICNVSAAQWTPEPSVTKARLRGLAVVNDQGRLGERDSGNVRAHERRRNYLESRTGRGRPRISISATSTPSTTAGRSCSRSARGRNPAFTRPKTAATPGLLRFQNHDPRVFLDALCLLGCRSWNRHGRPGRWTIHCALDRRRRHELETIDCRKHASGTEGRRGVRRQRHLPGCGQAIGTPGLEPAGRICPRVSFGGSRSNLDRPRDADLGRATVVGALLLGVSRSRPWCRRRRGLQRARARPARSPP